MTWKLTSIIFWKEQDLGAKEANKRRPEGPDEWAHVAQVPGHVGPPKILLGLPFVRFLGSYALFLPKNDPRKILGHLDAVWVLETSKYRK